MRKGGERLLRTSLKNFRVRSRTALGNDVLGDFVRKPRFLHGMKSFTVL